MSTDDLFDQIYDLPDPAMQRRLADLVGLEEVVTDLVKEARILINPGALVEWSQAHYKSTLPLVDHFMERHALVIFGGDVGTGKTVLAETFGDRVAREEAIDVKVFGLSLKTRSWGAVGQMTALITEAFAFVREEASHWMDSKTGNAKAAGILLIDEADSLAQSRELHQMHHEDRAGVNALVRGIDGLTASHRPVIVVMCTNRIDAIDPAVQRRAARIFKFARPTLDQRKALLTSALSPAGFSHDEAASLANETGERDGRAYGYSYSDLRQRLLPSLVLDAFPDEPLRFERAIELARRIEPTPPFSGNPPDVI